MCRVSSLSWNPSTLTTSAFAYVVRGSPASHTPSGTFHRSNSVMSLRWILQVQLTYCLEPIKLCLFLMLNIVYINAWTHYLVYFVLFFFCFVFRHSTMPWKCNHTDTTTLYLKIFHSTCMLYFIDLFIYWWMLWIVTNFCSFKQCSINIFWGPIQMFLYIFLKVKLLSRGRHIFNWIFYCWTVPKWNTSCSLPTKYYFQTIVSNS